MTTPWHSASLWLACAGTTPPEPRRSSRRWPRGWTCPRHGSAWRRAPCASVTWRPPCRRCRPPCPAIRHPPRRACSRPQSPLPQACRAGVPWTAWDGCTRMARPTSPSTAEWSHCDGPAVATACRPAASSPSTGRACPCSAVPSSVMRSTGWRALPPRMTVMWPAGPGTRAIPTVIPPCSSAAGGSWPVRSWMIRHSAARWAVPAGSASRPGICRSGRSPSPPSTGRCSWAARCTRRPRRAAPGTGSPASRPGRRQRACLASRWTWWCRSMVTGRRRSPACMPCCRPCRPRAGSTWSTMPGRTRAWRLRWTTWLRPAASRCTACRPPAASLGPRMRVCGRQPGVMSCC